MHYAYMEWYKKQIGKRMNQEMGFMDDTALQLGIFAIRAKEEGLI